MKSLEYLEIILNLMGKPTYVLHLLEYLVVVDHDLRILNHILKPNYVHAKKKINAQLCNPKITKQLNLISMNGTALTPNKIFRKICISGATSLFFGTRAIFFLN